MASFDDNYIKSIVTRDVYFLIRPNINGNADGNEDQRKVFERNTNAGVAGNPIRNKYRSANTGKYEYFTEATVRTRFRVSSSDEYDETQTAAARRRTAENNRRNAAAMAAAHPPQRQPPAPPLPPDNNNLPGYRPSKTPLKF